MDYLKDMKERQERFLQEPRKGIEDVVAATKNFTKGLVQLSYIQSRPDLLLLHKNFQKQYSDLVSNLMKEGLVHSDSFKDDIRSVSTFQTIKEMESIVQKHTNKSEPLETLIHSLKRSYASFLEILWGILKRIIFLAGLNPKELHLNVIQIENKLSKLENRYSIDLSLLKNILNSKLRNCINHEKTYFDHPNHLVFMKEVEGRWVEFNRTTDEEILEELLKIFSIISTLNHVEAMCMTSYLERLLILNDEELNKYCKIGKLTKEMHNKIYKDLADGE